MEKEYFFNAGIPPPLHFQPSLSPLQMPNNFHNPNFEKSTEHYSQFETALSSMVTSPAPSNSATDAFAIRELIGKLGTICNAGVIAPELMPRKVVSRGKAKETAVKEAEGDDDSSVKRSKMTGCSGNNNGGVKMEEETNRGASDEDQKQANNNQKPPEPPKDYIHVRARRGQATDSHSLAERVRREKIGERMKLLQDLVPGCNKVTGKALMLDEIINYVQSLQRQVEFLSMKLATVNPSLDVNMDSLLSKDTFQSNGTMPHQIYPVDATASASALAYYGNRGLRNPQVHKSVEPLDATLCRNLCMPLDGFGEGLPQFPAFSEEDDLQSIVQMGFAPNQTSHMKIEL